MFYIFLNSGTKWLYIPGRLNQIESGPNGVVWGTTRANYIYYRAGVHRRRPTGRNWVRVGGRLRFVSPGCTGVYGVSKSGRIWRFNGNIVESNCRETEA